MPVIWTTTPLKSAPAAADGVSVSPGGSSFANGAWVELIASASADLAVIAIVTKGISTTTQHNAEFELGVGAAGAW